MERIDEAVKDTAILIFTKGTPKFSVDEDTKRSLAIMKEYNLPFSYVNLLDDLDVYQNLHRYQDCVQIPQFYISGKLMGDYDALVAMHEKGQLKSAFEVAIEIGIERQKEKQKEEQIAKKEEEQKALLKAQQKAKQLAQQQAKNKE